MSDKNKRHPNVTWIEEMAGVHRPTREGQVDEGVSRPVVAPERVTDVPRRVREQIKAGHDAGFTIPQLCAMYPTLKREWIEEFCRTSLPDRE